MPEASPCPSTDAVLPGSNFCQKPGSFPFTLELPEERAPEPLAKKDPPCAIWMPYFKDPNFIAAPVNCFKHVRVFSCWVLFSLLLFRHLWPIAGKILPSG